MALSEKIWQRIKQTEDCWLWLGYCDPKGYGLVYNDNKMALVHREVYIDARGPIPDGLELDHLCEVPNCVNPNHLEPVTHQENIRRGSMRKTHCRNGHVKLIENCYTSPKGVVCCLTCIRDNASRSYEANRETRKAKQREYNRRTYVHLPPAERSRIARENALKRIIS